jgi:3',5'-cyclic AMP phosphodiesterase CpdA
MTIIYQITDTHVPPEEGKPVRANFVALMDFVARNPADLLVLTGDLPGEDGNKEVYEWMKEQLPENQLTYVIPGNHDDDENLFDAFGEDICVNREFFHTLPLDEIDLVFTNSGSGILPPEQLDYLSSEVIRQHSVLFTHYPTRKISDGFMDSTYPLKNHDQADTAISRSKIDHVFCGHFHTEHASEGNYNLHVTPSPAFEIDLNDPEIKISKGRVPIRKIQIDGSTVSTEVIYL